MAFQVNVLVTANKSSSGKYTKLNHHERRLKAALGPLLEE